MGKDKVIERLKKEFVGEILPPITDDKLTRPCPKLLDENIERFERWTNSTDIAPKFNTKRESIVSLEHCKSFNFGKGCKYLKKCWGDN